MGRSGPRKGGRGLRVCIVRKSGIHLGLRENDVSVADVSVHVETRRFFIRTPSINFREEKTCHRRPFATHPAWPLVKYSAGIRILFPHPQNIFFTPSVFIYLFRTRCDVRANGICQKFKNNYTLKIPKIVHDATRDDNCWQKETSSICVRSRGSPIDDFIGCVPAAILGLHLLDTRVLRRVIAQLANQC